MHAHENGANELIDHLEQPAKSCDSNKSLHLEDNYSELGAPEVPKTEGKTHFDITKNREEADFNNRKLVMGSKSERSLSDDKHIIIHKSKNYALILEIEEEKLNKSVQLEGSLCDRHLEEPYDPNSDIGKSL
jgi:hypothetical protein